MKGSPIERPNVVLVLADDLGFSDLGCYGGEIETPTLNGLAQNGVRLSQFYNTARCSPSRASLLTGLHPHQTGIGILTRDDRPGGYPGSLNERCVTLSEVLGEAGYRTCLVGKWHITSDVWNPNGAWPTQRGFDRFYGTLTGCGSYYQPRTLTRDEENVEEEALVEDFYYTDAISSEAEAFIREHSENQPTSPFFLYAAYTAPHWPLHAPLEDVAKYAGRFDSGWDELRRDRLRRLVELGVVDDSCELSERDPTQHSWSHEEHKGWSARRMEVYAAQVDRMDQGIARIVSALSETGTLDNTLFLFLSDNGASAEELPPISLDRFKRRTDIVPSRTRDGREVEIGNRPEILPGHEDTYASYGRAWANLSNVPFRLYKRWVHEGGIAAPFIVHWPGGLGEGGLVVDTPFQLTDVMPTILEATGVAYPSEHRGREILPLEGRSMLPAWRGKGMPPATLYWEHTGNAAVRRGDWKLVRTYTSGWELYHISDDRAESEDVAANHPRIAQELLQSYEGWATRVGVIPWDQMLTVYAEMGRDEDPAG